jgi:branched-chain amino acid transport system substrate-binding protein
MNKASVFALALAALVFAGCKGASDPEKRDEATDIAVGEFASLTGGTATFGQSSHKGTQMAIDEINSKGGLLGKKVALYTEDDRSTAGEPGTVVRKLINKRQVVAVLGEVASKLSLEAAPICQKAKVPMISPASTNPKVTEVGDYIFRVCFIDPFQGTVVAKFASSRGWKRVAILTDVTQDYSVGLSQFFKEYAVKNGMTVVSEQSYSTNDKDFKAQLTNLKGQTPDAVLASGYYTETALILRQARELGLNVPFLGGDGWDSPSLVQVGGPAMEGNFFSNHFSDEDKSPAVQDFLQRFKAKFNEEADAMAALGYDSMMLLADAITRAKSVNGSKLREALATTKDYPGVTGKITMNPQRNADKPAVVLEIKNGKFKYVETVAP